MKRTRLQIEQECDEILKLQVKGHSPKDIMQIRNLPQTTYYEMTSRIQDMIVSEQSGKRQEEILVHAQVLQDRLTRAMNVEDRLMNGEKVSHRTQMEAGTKYGELAMMLFKLQIERASWMDALRLSSQVRLDVEPIDSQDDNNAL